MYNKLKFLRISLSILHVQRMPFYAVAKGRKLGIFYSWAECAEQVQNFKGPVFRKFKYCHEAKEFLLSHGIEPKTDSEDDSSSQGSVKEPNEFWPSDISDDGDNLLVAAAEEVGDIAQSPRKRKHDLEESSSKQAKHESIVWEPVGIKKFGKFSFPIDSEGYVIVYTDGSCEGNGTAMAVAGFGVYFSENHPLNTALPVSGRATNNCGEIQAAIYAIKLAKDVGISKLCLSTDSQFLINSITKWLRTWKRKGWTLKSGGPVKNAEDFKILDRLLMDKTIQIKWNYVRGHNGIVGNEKADRLARQGAEMYRKSKNK